MKIIYGLLLCYTTLLSTHAYSCPTCVGRVSRQSAPFFSNACYYDKSKKRNCTTPRSVKLSTKPTAINKKQGV